MAYAKPRTGKDTKSGGKHSELLKRARDCFKVAVESDQKQRERERDDLEFQVGEKQWTDEQRNERKGRPCIAINKLDQPRRLILNQMRQADLGVQFHPTNELGTDETAEMLDGLYREVERRSRAELVRYWAFDRAVSCGRGAYRMATEYDPDSDNPTDQRVVLKRILRQEGVYFDPSANEPDFRDGKYAFVVRWLSKEQFEAEFPGVEAPPEKKTTAYETLRAEAPEWVDDDSYCVAEYWWKEETAGKPAKDGYPPPVTTKVQCAYLCGWTVVQEPQVFPGRFIPLIPAIGVELQPFDEERRFVGMIGPAKDGQVLYNYAANTLVERLQLEPRAPYVASKEAIEGYEDYWKTANTKNWPVLPFNLYDSNGRPIPPPERAQIDPGGMSLSLQALMQADQFIQSATAVFEPSLGRLSNKERSGRALLALQQQGEAGTNHFLQSLADVSMTLEADIFLDIAPIIYGRKGRAARIVMGDDRRSKPVILGAPYVTDMKTRRPRLAREGEEGAKTYDLKAGRYGVAVTVGRSAQTRMMEGAEFTAGLLEKAPQLLEVIGDIVFQYRDEPGAKEISKRLAKMARAKFPQLFEGEEGEPPSPEQLMAENQRLKGEMQQAGQAMQAAQQALQTDEAKQRATLEKARMDAEAKVRTTEADNQTKLAVAELTSQTQLAIAEMKAAVEQMKAMAAGRQADIQRDHEMRMGHSERMAAAGEAERGREHEAGLAAKAQQADMVKAVAGSSLEEPERPRE